MKEEEGEEEGKKEEGRKEGPEEGRKGRWKGGRGAFSLNLYFVSGPGLGGTFRWARQRGQRVGRSRSGGGRGRPPEEGLSPLKAAIV